MERDILQIIFNKVQLLKDRDWIIIQNIVASEKLDQSIDLNAIIKANQSIHSANKNLKKI